MAPTSSAGLCSVIVPCLGQVETARQCLAALLRHTRRPWELIVVSSGGKAFSLYLAGVQDAAQVRVVVVKEVALRGSRHAWHRGLRAAQGEYVALLEGRTVVTDAWLDQLVALADSDPAIGMAAPMSNAAPLPQRADGANDLGDLAGLDAFAARWRSARRGQWFSAEVLAGPCLLLKHRVLDAIGSGQELKAAALRADRLSEQIRQAGFRLAVAHDLYVHQASGRFTPGSSTGHVEAGPTFDPPNPPFVRGGECQNAAAREIPSPLSISSPLTKGGQREVGTADLCPSEACAAPGRACKISLTMIVRDEEANLPACLGSAAGLFDEIVVVDTGSTDRTAPIARSFGARVFAFAWVDDFAAARNAALSYATGDYAFWLDADDRIEPSHQDRLRTLFDGLDSTGAAYVVRCACDPDAKGGGGMVVDHVRLFPLRGDVRWTYRVHEQILPALRRAGVPVRWTDAVVRHVGYNDPALRRKKLERDQAILAVELAERPDEPFVLFNLGQVALDLGDPRAALGYFERSLARSAPADSITHKLHALMARAHQNLGESDRALAACAVGLADDPDDAELLFRKGVLHRLQGQPDEAGACWRRILTLRRPERFASVDAGIYGHVTRRNLAVLAEEQGDLAEAVRHWAEVLAERPGDADAALALRRLCRLADHVRDSP